MTNIRLFSPFTDKTTLICNDVITKDYGTISPGFNDLEFKDGCKIQTSELTLYSPVRSQNEADIEVTHVLPDLGETFKKLSNDIELTHKINMSKISVDFNKLSEQINIEAIDAEIGRAHV